MDTLQISSLPWSFGWSACSVCGSLRPGVGTLCSHCEAWMDARLYPKVFEEEGIIVRSLFDWDGEDEPLSQFLVSLKGPGQRKAWRHWAETFVCHHEISHLERALVVSGPVAEEGEDHSEHFAQEIASALRWTYEGRPMRKIAGERSVFLSRKGRERAGRFVKNSDFLLRNSCRPVVFVDDVRTSGSTARAIYENMGRPRHFEHWVLAHRLAMRV